jgi:hypothetical protein
MGNLSVQVSGFRFQVLGFGFWGYCPKPYDPRSLTPDTWNLEPGTWNLVSGFRFLGILLLAL